jgi:pyruvate dehydrogenase E1 component alpha subunit
VFRAPVIFFCQNNQWAISVPISRQTVAPIYRKADAYGFPGVRVDGNDVLAVYRATREAAELARTERTPTLIEAVTYRIGPHSTADDASRYRAEGQVDEWRARDPIERYRRYLEAVGVVDRAFLDGCEEEAGREAARIRRGVTGAGPRPVDELFRWVFGGDLPEHLRRQRDEVMRYAGDADEPGGAGRDGEG